MCVTALLLTVKLCERAGCTGILVKPRNKSRADFAKRRFCSPTCRDLHRRQVQASKVCPCGSGAPHYALGLCWVCYSWQTQGKRFPVGTLHPQQVHDDVST